MKINDPLDDIFQNKNYVRVLRYLSRFPSGMMTGRGIAKELGMNHATCINVLNSLADMGVIQRRTVGAGSIFQVINESKLFSEILKPLFQAEDHLLTGIVSALTKGIKRNLISAYVFGSVARKEDNAQSDIDVAFIHNDPMDKERTKELLRQNERKVYLDYGIGAHALAYTVSEWESMKRKNHALVKEILSQGVQVIGKGI